MSVLDDEEVKLILERAWAAEMVSVDVVFNLSDALDERAERFEKARTYKGTEEYTCPLCRLVDGEGVELCEMHNQIEILQAKVKELENRPYRPQAVIAEEPKHEAGCNALTPQIKGMWVQHICTCGAVKEPKVVMHVEGKSCKCEDCRAELAYHGLTGE